MRDILLAGIYDVDICRDVLSDASMASKSINDIISIIESKESARDAVTALSSRAPAPEAAAASSYSNPQNKAPGTTPKAPKPQNGGRQNDSQRSPTLLPGSTPRRLRCTCGKFFMDYAQYQSSK